LRLSGSVSGELSVSGHGDVSVVLNRKKEITVTTSTLLIILVVVLLVGGGGWGWSRRSR
jgi:hypothetical protein